MKWALAALAVFALPTLLAAAECRETSYAGNRYELCEVDLTKEDLRLFLYAENGAPFGHFGTLDVELEQQGLKLGFGMNAGMYHKDRSPVGHYVEKGVESKRIIKNAGPGNFGLLPNGVFCIRDTRADVIETLEFARNKPNCTFASQSGPMLVIDGALHPRFLKDSTSQYIRNGVGTNKDGTRATFVISDNAVTFHEFGSFFKDVLKTPNALYFDGNISRLYAPSIRSYGAGWRMGPIVGTVVPLGD